jgi:hypothetical protein
MNSCQMCDGKCYGQTYSMACAELYQAQLKNQYGSLGTKNVPSSNEDGVD